MRVLHPDMAIWLLGVPLAFGAWYLHVFAKRRFREHAALGGPLDHLSRTSTRARDWMALATAVLAVALLVLSLARPQLVLERRTPEYERQDLILVLDRSASMWARDISPSRFARAIQEIKVFLKGKPDVLDRVGLVGFAGSALMVSHLTRDMENLFFYLDWIVEDQEPQFGTDIGAALLTARDLARKDDRPTRKIFLMLSDGEEKGNVLADVLTALRDERIRVYTIGIGSDAVVPIPASDKRGKTTYVEDEDGARLYTRFNEATLRRIAAATGGRYVRSVTGNELAAAMKSVVDRETRLTGWRTSVEYRDLYLEPLGAAAVAMLAFLLTL